MADFGVGEVAATEGAKGAGEALAAPAAASEVVATPFAAAPAVTGTALAPAAAGAGGAAALEAGTAGAEGAIAGGAGTPAVPGAIGAAAAAPEISASIAPEVAAGAGGAAAATDPLVANLASTGTAGSDIAGGGLSGAAAAPSAAVPSVGGAADLGAGAGEVGAPAALPETSPFYPAGTQAAAPVVEKSMQTPDWLSKGMGAIANMSPNTALTGAGLGLNAYSQIAARNAMGDMQKQIKGAVAPLSSTQQGLLAQYNSGQLSAADQQAIQDYTAASKAQIRQQYAQMGQANSPQMAQAEAAVDQKAAAMMDQALKNYLTEALSVTGAITGPYAGLATQQIAQDAGLQNAAKGVFSAMGAQQSGRPAGT